ncbi:Zn-ribbon domain-containing OB-fold protein [Candidatus Giovannonibacteria bacterium]|nr:Zn-ribbon domain-containing OB-fold protein [Candidatus Giovannonibacteria bacterium]
MKTQYEEKNAVVSREPLRILIPRSGEHVHNYGMISKFFHGLSEHKLLYTKCENPACLGFAYLPPRSDCPNCWEPMKWMELKPNELTGKVTTFSVVHYPGAGYEEDLARVEAKLPSIIVYVELPNIDTKIMSRLENCDPGDVKIGMKVKARFRQSLVPRRMPTFTCLDLYFVPVE